MKLTWRRAVERPAWVKAPSGDKVLAAAEVQGGEAWLVGTRRHLSRVAASAESQTWPWDDIHHFDWDADEHTLRISLIGEFGQQREQPRFRVEEAALLLQLIRERITASVVYQRHIPVHGKTGFRVIGRRNPDGGEITWMFDLDRGLNADDPALEEVTAGALARARDEIGEPI